MILMLIIVIYHHIISCLIGKYWKYTHVLSFLSFNHFYLICNEPKAKFYSTFSKIIGGQSLFTFFALVSLVHYCTMHLCLNIIFFTYVYQFLDTADVTKSSGTDTIDALNMKPYKTTRPWTPLQLKNEEYEEVMKNRLGSTNQKNFLVDNIVSFLKCFNLFAFLI